MRHALSLSPPRRRRTLRVVALVALSLVLATASPAAAKQPAPAANAAVVAAWNGIAVGTIAGPPPTGAGMASPAAFIYFALVQIAVYNAVVGITGEYELYNWEVRAPKGASPEAAAAVAAHRVLRTYFGTTDAIRANLDARLAESLGAITDSPSKSQGIRYGLRAADHLIAIRANDGRGAAVNVPLPTENGDWRPTPTAFAPFAAPWLGGVTPLALDSYDTFDPGPPPAISSDLYEAEYEEVRITGDIDAPVTDRSDAMELTAKFFSDTGIGPMQAALRDLATRRGLDIDDSARMFAVVDTSIAEAIGTVWNAKLQYLWWRPVTAIQLGDSDGNDDTVGDSDWMPLIPTPPYPEWPSGLCAVVGVVSAALPQLNGDGTVDLRITSGPMAANETRHYLSAAILSEDAVNARVWSGIHFRTADEVSIDIGTNVANWVLGGHFQPTD